MICSVKFFRLCSDNVQTLFRLFRMFRICSNWTDSEHSEHWLSRVWTLSEKSEHSEQCLNILKVDWKFWTDSEKSEHCLKAPKLVYSEFLDFVVGEATNTNFIFFALTRSRFEPTIYRTRGEHANTNTTIWTVSEHSESWLKILNRFWKVWTLSEKSEHFEHCLKSPNILNIVWKVWTFWTLSEQSLNILTKNIYSCCNLIKKNN
jgi:hypothetical protein